ncbi:hypothetical protein REPUB_Repub04eG0100900 [Reevesia pubescens]
MPKQWMELNISQGSALGVQSKNHCENLSFCMVKGCWLLLVGVILSCKFPEVRFKLWMNRKNEPAPLQPVAQKLQLKTFGEYIERTAFERSLTSGDAYALKFLHLDREQFEKQHGWTIKKMETEDQALVQDCLTENLDPAPFKDEYAPVIFSQETVSHIVSIDMMSGKGYGAIPRCDVADKGNFKSI